MFLSHFGALSGHLGDPFATVEQSWFAHFVGLILWPTDKMCLLG